MSGEFKITSAKKSDLAAIIALLQMIGLPPDGIEFHIGTFFVIKHPELSTDNELESLIGSIGLEIYGKSALLRSFAVHPDFRGVGIGTRLVNRAIETAKEMRITHLFLLTDTAEDYFKNKGFAVVTRDQVPEDMKQSIEFTTLCTSAPSMMREI
jgi:amino-acid N-acetyltransferase